VRSQTLIDACLADCTGPQMEAIRHAEGPLLVVAGPGSGKTRVITRRIAHLVGSGCRPGEILAITFTNKAAEEMRNRVEALGAASGVWMYTFHAFCARVLRIYGSHVGLSARFTIYDTADSLAAVKRVARDLEIDPKLFKPAALARSISNAKGRLFGPDEVASSRERDAETIAKVYRRYVERLRASDAADFDDLLMLTVKLLKDVPKVAKALHSRFRYVLIDEYQDTNQAQYLIARNLARKHRNICATGDPDQSIYGWRGADIRNILAFEEDYPDAKVVHLEQNYRSTKSILSVADKLISHNLERKPKALWTENPEGEAVSVLCCEDENDEANRIAARMAELIRDNQAESRDMAVFYRTNAQSRVLETALRFETIPYTIVAGTEFYQRKEVKDILAYLRLIVNPADSVSTERIMNVPARGIGKGAAARFRAWAEKHGGSMLDAIAHPDEAGVRGAAARGARTLIKVLNQLREMPPCPVAPIVERLIASINFERYLSGMAEKSDERIANVRELVSAAAGFNQSEPEGDLLGFLEHAALVSDVDDLDESCGAVKLMTLHAAKGLEFPVVFVVGLEEGLLPLSRGEAVHDLEEERRLFFVGVTRAMKRLFLSLAELRTRYGRSEYTSPSRFLSELPEEIVSGVLDMGVQKTLSWQQTGAPASRQSAGQRETRSFSRSHRSPHGGYRRVKRGDAEEVVYDGEQPLDDLRSAEVGFAVNDWVIHPTYGRGRVVSMSGYGESMRASVRFPSVGVKRFSLKHARLKKA